MMLENEKMIVNIKVWSLLALIVMLIINFCFASSGASVSTYINILVILLSTICEWKMSEIKHIISFKEI